MMRIVQDILDCKKSALSDCENQRGFVPMSYEKNRICDLSLKLFWLDFAGYAENGFRNICFVPCGYTSKFVQIKFY